MQLFVKSESGEFVEASASQLEEVFKEKSGAIVAKRLNAIRESEMEKARPEFEKKIRAELEPKLKDEAMAAAKAEFQTQLDEANKTISTKDIELRRKTIAAEYGFKSELEKYLGDGTDEEMRKEAETLKANFAAGNPGDGLQKTNGAPKSESEELYGLDVKI